LDPSRGKADSFECTLCPVSRGSLRLDGNPSVVFFSFGTWTLPFSWILSKFFFLFFLRSLCPSFSLKSGFPLDFSPSISRVSPPISGVFTRFFISEAIPSLLTRAGGFSPSGTEGPSLMIFFTGSSVSLEPHGLHPLPLIPPTHPLASPNRPVDALSQEAYDFRTHFALFFWVVNPYSPKVFIVVSPLSPLP